MVYWITGRKNSGKTTLARRLQKQIPGSVIVDGDAVRAYFDTDYTDAGRVRNQSTIAKIARLVEKQGLVAIVACVSPLRGVRKFFQAMFDECIEIELPFGELWEGTEYEEEPLKEDKSWQMESPPKTPLTTTSGPMDEGSMNAVFPNGNGSSGQCRRPSTVWSVPDTIQGLQVKYKDENGQWQPVEDLEKPELVIPDSPVLAPAKEASEACGECSETATVSSEAACKPDRNFSPSEGPSI